VAGLCTIVEIAIVIFASEVWRLDSNIGALRANMRRCLVASFVLFVGYIMLVGLFVEDFPNRWSREVCGFAFVSDDIAGLVRSNPSKYTNGRLLEEFHTAPAVWTNASIDLVRVALLVIWLGMWTVFSIFIASFVAIQWRRGRTRARAGSSPSRTQTETPIEPSEETLRARKASEA
jgi:hypothetical protein